jgi:glutaredoxin 3
VPPEVVLYCAPDCVWCTAARDFLLEKRVPFTEIDVLQNRDKWRAARRLTGRSGLPILIVGGEATVGFERDELAKRLGIEA